jgi:hypothetical protein
MAPKAEGKSGQLAIRLEPAILEQLDRLAQKLSRPGASLSRSDAARMALLEGLAKIEQAELRRFLQAHSGAPVVVLLAGDDARPRAFKGRPLKVSDDSDEFLLDPMYGKASPKCFLLRSVSRFLAGDNANDSDACTRELDGVEIDPWGLKPRK